MSAKLTPEQMLSETVGAAESDIVATEDMKVPESPVMEPKNEPGQSSQQQQQQMEQQQTIVQQQRKVLAQQQEIADQLNLAQQKQHQTANTPITHPNLQEVHDMISQVMETQSATNMKMFQDLIKSQGMRVPEKQYSSEYEPPRQHENRIEAKSCARMTQFV